MKESGIIYNGRTAMPDLYKFGETGRPAQRKYDLHKMEGFTQTEAVKTETIDQRKIAEAILRTALKAAGCEIIGNDHYKTLNGVEIPVVDLMQYAAEFAQKVEKQVKREVYKRLKATNTGEA